VVIAHVHLCEVSCPRLKCVVWNCDKGQGRGHLARRTSHGRQGGGRGQALLEVARHSRHLGTRNPHDAVTGQGRNPHASPTQSVVGAETRPSLHGAARHLGNSRQDDVRLRGDVDRRLQGAGRVQPVVVVGHHRLSRVVNTETRRGAVLDHR